MRVHICAVFTGDHSLPLIPANAAECPEPFISLFINQTADDIVGVVDAFLDVVTLMPLPVKNKSLACSLKCNKVLERLSKNEVR